MPSSRLIISNHPGCGLRGSSEGSNGPADTGVLRRGSTGRGVAEEDGFGEVGVFSSSGEVDFVTGVSSDEKVEAVSTGKVGRTLATDDLVDSSTSGVGASAAGGVVDMVEC
jgi:hypothetical protein